MSVRVRPGGTPIGDNDRGEMKKAIRVLLGTALFMGVFVGMGQSEANAKPAGVDTVSAPVHNETTLSFFSCAATRQGQAVGDTVNHSHKIAADSVAGHIDAYDCESFNPPPGDILDGCVWRVYYVYDNRLDGQDIGIVGPGDQTCWLN